MRNIPRFLSIICLSLLVSACIFGGSSGTASTTTVDASGLKKHVWAGFSISIPTSWEVVSPDTITTPVTGKIELAVRSLVNKRGFMNNLVVLSDEVHTDATSAEYVRQNMLWASRNYLSMTMERDEQIQFSDKKDSSRLVTYHAKYNEITQERLFMQTARICGKKVYLITLGLDNDLTSIDYDRYRPIFSNFTCS